MRIKILMLLSMSLVLILSGYSPSNTMTEVRTEIKEEKNTSGQTEKDLNKQVVHYKDLSLTIPSDWRAVEEDGIFGIYGTSESGFGCLINAFDISEYVDDSTTKDDIYDYCLQFLGTDSYEDIKCEKGEFKGCPAVFYSFISEDDESGQIAFEGVCFAADTSVYLFTVGSNTGEIHEEEKQISQEIQKSITIDHSINISRYDNTLSPQNDSLSSGSSSEGLVFDKGVVYEGHDILISTDKIERENASTTFSFVIQNNSGTDYDIGTDSWDVNGIMMGDYNYVEVAAGKKAKLKLTVKNDVLRGCNINTISEIDMLVWARVGYLKKWNTGLIKVKTNQYSKDVRAEVDIEPHYSDDVIDVWYAGGNETDEFAFFIYNKSENNAYCTIKNCSVNDWSYDLTEYTFDAYRVPINSKAYAVITIPIDEKFSTMNDIVNVDSMEYDVFLENNDWKYHSERISFTRQ